MFALALALGACAAPPPAPCENVSLAAPAASPSASASAASASGKKGSLEVVPLSAATRRLVASTLTDELRIDAYVSRDFAPKAFVAALQGTLDQYQAATFERGAERAKSRARCEMHTLLNDAVDRREAINRGFSERPLVTDDVERVDLRRGFIGVEVTYKGKKEAIAWVPPDDITSLEFFLDMKIRELLALTEGAKIPIAIVTRGGLSPLAETNLYPRQPSVTLGGIFAQYAPFYELTDVDLATEAPLAEMPALVVIQQATAFTELDLAAIDAFLTVGGRTVIVVASSARTVIADPRMRATSAPSGLEPLLSAYGVELLPQVIVDPERAFALDVFAEDGAERTLHHPLIPVLGPKDLAPSFEPFRGLGQIPFPFASPLALHPEKQPGAKLSIIGHTSASATRASPTAHSFRFDDAAAWSPEGGAAEQPVAVLVEGLIASAFDSEKVSRSNSRLLVISSSAFLVNPFARAGNPPPMPPQMTMMGPAGGDEKLQAMAAPYSQKFAKVAIATLLNLLDWSSGNGDFAELTAKLVATRD